MTMETLVIPKPAYNVLRQLTGESRPDIALGLALKALVRLRLAAAQAEVETFEQKYAMTFEAFAKAWQAGEIPDAYSYAIEQDYWAWEAAPTDIAALKEISKWLV